MISTLFFEVDGFRYVPNPSYRPHAMSAQDSRNRLPIGKLKVKLEVSDRLGKYIVEFRHPDGRLICAYKPEKSFQEAWKTLHKVKDFWQSAGLLVMGEPTPPSKWQLFWQKIERYFSRGKGQGHE